jgi:hypothetical protein
MQAGRGHYYDNLESNMVNKHVKIKPSTSEPCNQYERVSIISETGAAICTTVVVE